MLFCSTMFGQHWTMTEAEQTFYQGKMSYYTYATIDGDPIESDNIEIAAFHGNELRGCAFQIYDEDLGYLFMIDICGTTPGDQIYFKLYKPDGNGGGVEYGSDFTINFNDEYVSTEIPTIDFYNKHWNYEYVATEYMQYPCVIKIDGVLQERTNLELAALCGEELRGVTRPQKENITEGLDIYMASLKIEGRNGDAINFKLYDPIAGAELTTDHTIQYDLEYGNQNVVEIEFKNNPVARIGEEGNAARYFATLEAAVEAAQDGETIFLLQDVTLTETLTIDKSITLDLNEKNVTLSTGGNMIKADATIKNGNVIIDDVDTKATANSNCFISTNVGASLTLDDIVMTGDGYTTHWAVLCAMSSSTAGSTINITNSTVTLSNEKGSAGGFIKDQSGVDNYSQINISNSTLTLTNVSRGFTGAKVTLNDVDLTITGGEHGINGSELIIKNGSNVSISNGTGRAITLNKFDASIAGSNVTISNMGEGGIRYKTANTLTVDASSTLSETTAHADVDNAKLNDKVVRGTESQMSTVKVENGVTTVINPVSGQVAYRAYIEDSENREAVKVDLQNVNALNSLAVKLYDANGNLLTTTTYRAGAVEAPEYLTCNIVLSGTASSSWETVINVEKLTVDNYPKKAELLIDGTYIHTFDNILGNATDAAAYQLPAYKALGCVYKAASITRNDVTEYYSTIANANAATTDNDVVTILVSTNETIGVPQGNNVTFNAIEGVELSGGAGGSYYNKSVTFDGLTFKGGKGIALTAGVDDLTYTVKNCKFDGVQATAWKQGVISLNRNAIVVVENNIITDVQNATEGDNRIDAQGQQSVGIYTSNAVAVTISGNTITNVDGTGISSNGNTGKVDIKNNTVSAWGTGATAKNEGRAIRTSGGTEVAITGNVMIDNGTAKESFVKSTDFTTSLDASMNYWNGQNPVASDLFEADNTDPVNYVKNYYTDVDKQTLVTLSVSVAKVGDKYYQSVNEAINSADDDAIVQLLPGTIEEYVYPWPESNHSKEKSITILGSENFGTTLTGGLYLGYDDSQCREHNIVVRGINFTGKGILVACQKNVVIENNKFSNIADCVAAPGSANANAISVTGKNINAMVTGNVINGTASAGINLRDTKTVNVSGNTVTNTVHNSITVQNNTTAEGDIVAIKDNTLSNWGTGGEGRAVRIAGGATVSVNGNVMTKENAPEEFVKVTNATTVNASANYWNGVSPLTDGMFTGVEGDLVPVLVSYYTDVEKTNLVTLAPSVAKIGEKYYQSLAAAFADAAQTEELTTIELLPVTIEEDDDINTPEKTIKLPATIKNVIVKGADNNTSILKNLTIQDAQGGTYDMSNITFDGVVFDNSNIVLTGWRTGFESLKNLIVKNCIFSNIVRSSANLAAVHINVAADKAVNGFTFINNVIDGVTGAQNSGIYGQFTGEVIVKDNTINNVAFRPYVIQLTTDDGIADEFTVTGNTFSGSAAGRAQALTNKAEGTDEVELIVSNNIFKDITAAQQICYWKFNEATTTATLEKNYYDINVMENPGGIYYNSQAQNISELSEMGIFPIYTELNADGTINEESLFDPVAYVGTKAFETLDGAVNKVTENNNTIVVIANVENVNHLIIPAGKNVVLDLNGKTISGVCNTSSEHNADLIEVENTATLTIKDSSENEEGKVTYASGTYKTGFTVDVKGNLILESGTIELTDSWSLGFAVDVRPNAWGTAYTEASTFVMNGGKVVSSDTGVRIDSNSGETNPSSRHGVYFTMNGGDIISDWDAIFIQHRYANDLYVNIAENAGTIQGKNSPLRIYGDGVVSDVEINIAGGTFDYTGDEGTTGWVVEKFLKATEAQVEAAKIEITGGTFDADVSRFCAFNYVCTSNGDGTYGIEYKPQEDNAFVIETLHELEAFRDAVNAGNDFSGKVFKLKSNIDLNPTRAINYWEPIGTQANPFKGTFDGGDNTIIDLVVEGENNVGLFGYATDANIKNVKIVNANVKGTDCVAALIGQGYASTYIDNCHVSGSIKVEGQTNVGGIVGKYYARVTNSSVIGDGVATSYVKGTYEAEDFEGDNIGGIMGHAGENNTHSGNTVKNITISGTRKVGGLIGTTDRATDIDACLVDNVVIGCTAEENYANDKASTTTLGGLVGNYYGESTGGTVTNTVVKNVTFNVGNAKNVGPIVGGNRTTPGAESIGGVTASGNLIYMSTISENTTNTYLMHAVAKIGETKYYTLQEAVDAGNGETINVIGNTTEVINIADNAVIDLNFSEGVTLNGYILAPNADLTINDGTISNTNSAKSAVQINAGKLELNNVNITSARHAMRIEGTNGEVIATINGGTYKLHEVASQTQHVLNAGGDGSQVTVTINNGTFVGPKGTASDSGAAINVQTGSTVTIEGGEFSGGKNATLGVSGTMIVKGGTFDQDPSAYLADAYTVNIENEMYVVRYTPIKVTYPVGNPVYPEGKVEYYSDMLEAVPYTTNCPRLEGATITLLADVSGAGMRFMENDMVFDLNGHTYTITAGTGSQGTNTSGFQIRPEVTTNVLFKNGTIKVAEGAPVAWMFNCYATDFIVENVTVDCSNMAYSYGEYCYVVVSREGDNVQLTGETKIVNFNSDVAGNAINVGDTMTIGEYVDLGGGTIELDGGAQLTAPEGLNVVTVGGYMVVYENGVYKSVKVVAQVGENKFGSVIAALNYAIENNEAQVKIVSDSRELMPTDVYLRLNADLEITAEQPYTVKFYNNGTSYDFVVGSYNSNTLTFGKNVTFQLEDRIIWLGYYGNDVDVVVNGTLAASQIWHGADTKVTSTGTIKSTGEAFVMRRGATLTVDGGTVNANYFNILAGNIDAENANITCGAMWIANTGNYIYEGNVNINIKSSTLTSNGNLKSSTAHADGVSINFENSEVTFVLFDGGFVSVIDANTKLNVKGTNAAVSIKGLTNNGLVNVTEEAKLTLTGTITNNGAMKLDATSVIYAPENLGVTIDDNDYDVVYENGAYRAVHKPFVAEVDGTQFTSLQAAINAADGKTVVVLDNITLTETLTVAAGTTVTLDLNGKTVSAEATFAVKAIVNNGTLTINGNGGTIDISASTTESIQVVDNYGTLTISGGTYKGASSNFSYAIRANHENSVTNIVGATITTYFGAVGINKGETTITDGKFEVTSEAGGHALYVANAEVTINGGEFIPYANGYSYAVLTNDANAKVSITGGTFKKGLGDPCVKALSGNIILTGGTFSTDVNEYCHEYYDAVTEDNITWTVEQVLFAQTTELQAGWNWFSSYVDLSQEGGLLKLQTALDKSGLAIKGQTGNQSVQYGKIGVVNGEEIYAWTGNQNWNPYSNKMYMVRTSAPITVEIEGDLIDYENTTIALFQGWNWISYPLSEPAYANEALAGLTPTEGDQIKAYGANTYIEYSEGEWFPYDFVFMPGEGYMYKAGSSNSFVYAKGTTNVIRATNKTTENNNWIAQTSEYANNMTITAMLSIDGEVVNDNYEIAAFANGECRGSARPIYIEKFDAYILFMTVYGEEVEDLTFRYYDVNYGTEYELDNRVVYSNDASLGSINDPYMFTLNITGVDETSMSEINIYPNPTTIGSEINLQATCDKVEVFNALGVKVAEYHNVDTLDAFETAGIYVIRITNDNAVKHCRLVVK